MSTSPHVAFNFHVSEEFDFREYVLKISRRFLKSLNEENLIYTLRAFANMVVIDGKISPEEFDIFHKVFDHLPLDEDKKAKILKILETAQAVKLKGAPEIPKKQAVTIMRITAFIAIADGEFHKKEKMYLKYLGEQLGFVELEMKEFIDWAETEVIRIESLKKKQ